MEASNVGEMSMCLGAATQERTVYACTFEGEKKGGKGSLTYDVKYIDTDLTECTKPPQAAYSNLLLSNTRALNKKKWVVVARSVAISYSIPHHMPRTSKNESLNLEKEKDKEISE